MGNVFDYLHWRGDLSFCQDPVNAVDGLVFSTLTYLPFIGSLQEDPGTPVSFQQVTEEFLAWEDKENHLRMKNDLELLKAAAATRRFGSLKLVHYREEFVPEEDTQFAAITFLLDDGSIFVAFRGTDNTLVGWKEDFNMSFQKSVPAQRLAVEYTENRFWEYRKPLYLGGHSKGGNLAVFASAKCSPLIRSQIQAVYNNDGPGFTEYMMGDPGYIYMVPKIHTYVPQSSVIGLLMEHEEPYTVVHSRQLRMLQHDTFSWEILGKDFVCMEEITADSRFLNQTIKNWLAELDNEERNQLVEAVFSVLSSGDIESVGDILHPKNIRKYIRRLDTDENARRILSEEFHNLVEASRRARQMQEEAKHMET